VMQRQRQLAEAGRADPSATAVTWTFSAEYAEHLSPGVSIRSLLTLAALLDGHGIPGAVFTTAAAGEYLAGDGRVPGAGAADPQWTWNAIGSLRQAGLLTVEESGTSPTGPVGPGVPAGFPPAGPRGPSAPAAPARPRP